MGIKTFSEIRGFVISNSITISTNKPPHKRKLLLSAKRTRNATLNSISFAW